MTDLGEPLAIGRTAEVYPWPDGKVLKLYFPSVPLSWIDAEMRIGQYTQDMHLPVPRLYERITLNGREGLVYERVEGPSGLSKVGRKPWTALQAARLLARLHAQVHAVAAPSHLEPQREWARGGILETEWLPEDLRQAVIQLLDSLPDGSQLCHGDFHPGNILFTARGPVIIDWMTATRGTAVGDVARTSIILKAAQPPAGIPRWLLELIRRLSLASYLRTYFRLRPEAERLFASWQAIMAANFLLVSQPEERPPLIRLVKQGLGKGLDG